MKLSLSTLLVAPILYTADCIPVVLGTLSITSNTAVKVFPLSRARLNSGVHGPTLPHLAPQARRRTVAHRASSSSESAELAENNPKIPLQSKANEINPISTLEEFDPKAAIKTTQECLELNGKCGQEMKKMAEQAGDITSELEEVRNTVAVVEKACDGSPDPVSCARDVVKYKVLTPSGIPRQLKLLGQELDNPSYREVFTAYGILAGLVMSLKYTPEGSHLWTQLISHYSTFDLVVWVSFIMSTSVYWGGAIGWRLAELFGDIKPYKIQYREPILTHQKWLEYAKDILGHQFMINLPMGIGYHYIQKSMGLSVEHVPSLFEFVGHIIGCSIIQDVMYYFLHKAAHRNPKLYKAVHSRHHESRSVYAVMANYASVWEHAIINVLPILVGPTILHSDLPTFWFWLVFATSSSINAHSGYRLLANTGEHDAHHALLNGIFGTLEGLDAIGGSTKALDKARMAAQKLKGEEVTLPLGELISNFKQDTIKKLEMIEQKLSSSPSLTGTEKAELEWVKWARDALSAKNPQTPIKNAEENSGHSSNRNTPIDFVLGLRALIRQMKQLSSE